MPAPWQPMEPVLWPEPFDDPAWCFQPKWDGVRGLAVVAGGAVRIFGRSGGERTRRYPELTAELPAAVAGRDCWLDGEIVALVDGRPSFERVMRRALAADPAQAAHIPVHYAVFDLVRLDGADLRPRPLTERLARLADLLRPQAHVLGTPVTTGAGRALFAAVRERQLEGVVAKRADSPYLPGPSPLWRKVKVRRRQLCVVTGYTTRGGQVRSLRLGAYAGGRLVDLGGVASGLTDEQLRLLGETLARLPPAPPPAGAKAGAGVRFVAPALTVLVAYAERGADGRLRAPVVVGFPGADPAQATLVEGGEP